MCELSLTLTENRMVEKGGGKKGKQMSQHAFT